MAELRVWAPNARRVEAVLRAGRHEMRAAGGGWFHGDGIDVEPGDDYSFSLDGGDPRPDPRSPWQPRGIDGPSRMVDHGSFTWTDEGWRAPPLPSAVIYELHVGTFTSDGTFEAAVARLDHLVELGVDAVELLPVAEFSGRRGWGYDGVDLYAPHHAYGGPHGLAGFVDACHARGLAVIMDVVYNHLGPAGNYLTEFGPYFTDRYSTPWGRAVNFDDAGSDEVRRFFIDNALMWLRDYHCDGLRLDAVHAIYDRSAVHFLEQLNHEVRLLQTRLGQSLWVIAESDLNDPRIVTDVAAGGYGSDAQWSDDLHHALHARLTGEHDGYYADFGRIEHIAKALRSAFVYDGVYSAHRDRVHGRPTTGLDGHRFLGYLQNHDQVGNRALGERSAALMSPGLLKVGAALVLTSPFVPMLFMGEEWGASTPFQYFTDHADPELGRAVSEGRRSEFSAFGWQPEQVPDPQDAATFQRSKLNWDEKDRQPHDEILQWHRELIRLRKRTPALMDGNKDALEARYDEDAGWLVVRRGPVTIAANLSDRRARIPVAAADRLELLLSSAAPPKPADGSIELEPESVSILSW